MDGGTLKCWGYNGQGQLGDNTTVDRLTPVDVVGLGGTVVAVALSGTHSCALLDGGALKCWGQNGAGRLGDGTTTTRLTPVDVGLGGTAVAVGLGGEHSCALLDGGTIKCWGWNGDGKLGDGTDTNRLMPVSVVAF
mmetsp:Transcript_26509/g.61293  ORF Transcript_26509/g.61293 Transcript_26509/m.61293 type:complete len:136 (-) Transcript_26509:249-656(-)